MPRQSIEDLKLPPAQYRPDKRTDDPSGVVEFETQKDCEAEDRRRIRILEAFLRAHQ